LIELLSAVVKGKERLSFSVQQDVKGKEGKGEKKK
jgi:hypothetical protein